MNHSAPAIIAKTLYAPRFELDLELNRWMDDCAIYIYMLLVSVDSYCFLVQFYQPTFSSSIIGRQCLHIPVFIGDELQGSWWSIRVQLGVTIPNLGDGIYRFDSESEVVGLEKLCFSFSKYILRLILTHPDLVHYHGKPIHCSSSVVPILKVFSIWVLILWTLILDTGIRLICYTTTVKNAPNPPLKY